MGACCSKALQLGVVAGLTFGAGRLAHRYNRTSATAGFRAFTKGIGEEMTTARASTREEALRLLNTSEIAVVELDYETGWQDAVELGRMGQKAGIRVEFRSQENIAVRSLKALVAGLSRPKLTFRQRNLYCQFDLDALPWASWRSWKPRLQHLGTTFLAVICCTTWTSVGTNRGREQ